VIGASAGGAETLKRGMPATALAHVAVDAVLPSELVADTIVAMVKGEHPPPVAGQDDPEEEPSEDDPGVTHRYSQEGLLDAQAINNRSRGA
jgi:hypothetical protein